MVAIYHPVHGFPKFAVRQSSSKEVTSRFATGVPLLPLSHYTLRYSTSILALSPPTPDAVSVSTHFRGSLRLSRRCVSTCTVLSMMLRTKQQGMSCHFSLLAFAQTLGTAW